MGINSLYLNEHDLKEQLIKFGYFSDHIPPCFSSELLYNHYEALTSSCDKGYSESLTITIAKNDDHRRTIKIPNPEQQLLLFKYILDNIEKIQSILRSNKHSLSNPIKTELIHYDDEATFFDIPFLKDKHKIRSSYIKSLDTKIRKSMGYKFLYKLDLSNFYDSIYTHAIEWAIIGKDKAKENVHKKTYKNNLGEMLDKLVRNTNYNETSGIPTGPFSSRIISELILKKIDNDIENLTKEVGFKFIHYVDDYEFYFRNEADFKKIIPKIRKVFDFYRLKINESKSKFYYYPFHNAKDLKEEFSFYIQNFKKSQNKHEVRLLFFKADELVQRGEKGAYKYLYKQLDKTDLTFVWKEIEPFLIGHLLIKPSLAQYIINIIVDHDELVSNELLIELRENLFISIENHMDNEAQWLFWTLRKLKYNFSAKDIAKLLKLTEDDILIIMILDTAHYEKKIETKSVSKAIDELLTRISNDNLRSERWLLIYEWVFNKWYKFDTLESKINDFKFFKALKNRKINFYTSIEI